MIPGVVRADSGNGESTLLEGNWSFTEKENLEAIPKPEKTMTCDLIFTPKDDNYPYYKVKGVEVHVEKKTPHNTAIHESESYVYKEGSLTLRIWVELWTMVPADGKGIAYSYFVTGDKQIFDDYAEWTLKLCSEGLYRQEHDRKNGYVPCKDRNGKL